MALTNAGADFETLISQTGVTIALLYEQRSCAVCQQLKDVFAQLANANPDATVLLVNTLEAPTIKFKYGVINNCIMLFNKGVFAKRYFQSTPTLPVYQKAIDRLKAGDPVDLPAECVHAPPMKPAPKVITVPVSELATFIADEKNFPILTNHAMRFYKDGDNIVFFGLTMVPDRPL